MEKLSSTEPGLRRVVLHRFENLICQRGANAYDWAWRIVQAFFIVNVLGVVLGQWLLMEWKKNDMIIFSIRYFMFGVFWSIILCVAAAQKARVDLIRDINYFRKMIKDEETLAIDGSREYYNERIYNM